MKRFFFSVIILTAFAAMNACEDDKKEDLAIVVTNAASSITSTTALSGGTVNSDGNADVIAKGVCWDTITNPTIDGSSTHNGTGTGSFVSHLVGLLPNKTYYVRSYATNKVGTAYGNEINFSTKTAIPSVTTMAVTGVTTYSAICGGNITSDSGSAVTARGVCWSTSQNPTIADPKTTDGNGSGIYTSSITGLAPHTTYYVRAYATNSSGTGYGIQDSLTTNAALPSITTSVITNVLDISATGGGNVTSDSGSPVTARGVCWSTTPYPTIAGSHTSDGNGTGSFTSSITGLSPFTKYYVRAYATNSIGTAYGNQENMTTIITDIDGNLYHAITIGTQTWMVENLKTKRYRNGDAIQNVIDAGQWTGLTTGAYCNYDNNPSNATTYGRLYNWYAVNDSRNIAPTGWHVASVAEWDTLVNRLGGSGIAGEILKATSGWSTGGNGTNEYGFTALPGGCRGSNDGIFYYIGTYGIFWSATENNASSAWNRRMYSGGSGVYTFNDNKGYGFSVRCVKD